MWEQVAKILNKELSVISSIETVSCMTQHQDYTNLTKRVVLEQVGPRLRGMQGKPYRRRAATFVTRGRPTEIGSLSQTRAFIGRTRADKGCKNFAISDEFFCHSTKGHLLAALTAFLGLDSPEDHLECQTPLEFEKVFPGKSLVLRQGTVDDVISRYQHELEQARAINVSLNEQLRTAQAFTLTQWLFSTYKTTRTPKTLQGCKSLNGYLAIIKGHDPPVQPAKTSQQEVQVQESQTLMLQLATTSTETENAVQPLRTDRSERSGVPAESNSEDTPSLTSKEKPPEYNRVEDQSRSVVTAIMSSIANHYSQRTNGLQTIIGLMMVVRTSNDQRLEAFQSEVRACRQTPARCALWPEGGTRKTSPSTSACGTSLQPHLQDKRQTVQLRYGPYQNSPYTDGVREGYMGLLSVVVSVGDRQADNSGSIPGCDLLAPFGFTCVPGQTSRMRTLRGYSDSVTLHSMGLTASDTTEQCTLENYQQWKAVRARQDKEFQVRARQDENAPSNGKECRSDRPPWSVFKTGPTLGQPCVIASRESVSDPGQTPEHTDTPTLISTFPSLIFTMSTWLTLHQHLHVTDAVWDVLPDITEEWRHHPAFAQLASVPVDITIDLSIFFIRIETVSDTNDVGEFDTRLDIHELGDNLGARDLNQVSDTNDVGWEVCEDSFPTVRVTHGKGKKSTIYEGISIRASSPHHRQQPTPNPVYSPFSLLHQPVYMPHQVSMLHQPSQYTAQDVNSIIHKYEQELAHIRTLNTSLSQQLEAARSLHPTNINVQLRSEVETICSSHSPLSIRQTTDYQEQNAPTLYNIIANLTSPQYDRETERSASISTVLLSTIENHGSRRSNGLQTIIGLMLVAKTPNDQVIQILNHAGMSVHPKSVWGVIKEYAGKTREENLLPDMVWVYDMYNDNIMKRVQEQRPGDKELFQGSGEFLSQSDLLVRVHTSDYSGKKIQLLRQIRGAANVEVVHCPSAKSSKLTRWQAFCNVFGTLRSCTFEFGLHPTVVQALCQEVTLTKSGEEGDPAPCKKKEELYACSESHEGKGQQN
ncbi:hypothetical protein Bbelb_381600 [Branchiostoma belcheri]|nr:hypothetical protein Bbelb_381600 [Branchiostoma belcheri]